MTRPSTAPELIHRLGLEPHPEGGYYREIFRSNERIDRGGKRRSALTTIHFLLEEGRHSRWHRVESDEVWHFLHGQPLELITFDAERERTGVNVLGAFDAPDCVPLHVVPAGAWQAARPLGDFALVSCTVGPGFDFADFCFVADIPEHRSAFETHLKAYADLL
jgi:uncharacterized protein